VADVLSESQQWRVFASPGLTINQWHQVGRLGVAYDRWHGTESYVSNSADNRTNTRGVNPAFPQLQVASNPHRMMPFFLRRNKSVQLLKIIVALAKLTVSSSSSVVQSINQSNYSIVRLKVDQRGGQLSLPHLGITKTEKIELKHKTDKQISPVNSLEP